MGGETTGLGAHSIKLSWLMLVGNKFSKMGGDIKLLYAW